MKKLFLALLIITTLSILCSCTAPLLTPSGGGFRQGLHEHYHGNGRGPECYNGFGVHYDYRDGHNFVDYIGQFEDNDLSGYGYWFSYEPDYSDGPDWEKAIKDEENKKFLQVAEHRISQIVMDKDDMKHVMLRYKGEFRNYRFNGECIYYELSDDGEPNVDEEGYFVDNELVE